MRLSAKRVLRAEICAALSVMCLAFGVSAANSSPERRSDLSTAPCRIASSGPVVRLYHRLLGATVAVQVHPECMVYTVVDGQPRAVLESVVVSPADVAQTLGHDSQHRVDTFLEERVAVLKRLPNFTFAYFERKVFIGDHAGEVSAQSVLLELGGRGVILIDLGWLDTEDTIHYLQAGDLIALAHLVR